MVVFSRLPDACLLALFKQLPLQDQLHARSVCRKWDTLIPIAASTRRSLILNLNGIYNAPRYNEYFYYEPFQPLITHLKPELLLLKHEEDGSLMYPPKDITIWNSVQFNALPKDICSLIASTFTGISALNVIFTSEDPKYQEMVAKLLQLWRHQLTSLHLVEHYKPSQIFPEEIFHLYNAVNLLFKLKRLILYLKRPLPQIDLVVISHLVELDIYIRDQAAHYHRDFKKQIQDHGQFMKMLQQYGEANQELVQVGYSFAVPYFSSSGHPFIRLPGHLRQAFTRLELSCFSDNFDLNALCNHFHSLMSLDLAYTVQSYGLAPLFYELSKLKQLLYLQLSFGIDQFPLPNAHHRLKQLPTVKALYLGVRLPTPQHLAALDIAWIFPNLQVITFNPGDGGFYDFRDVVFNNVPLRGNPIEEFYRQLFCPLKRRFGGQLILRHHLHPRHGVCSAEDLLAAM